MTAHPSGVTPDQRPASPEHSTRAGILDALAAALAMAVAMGFGRFAYTAIYPLMIDDGWLGIADGSLVASANYAGYLAGALGMTRVTAASAARLARLGLLGCVLLLAAMAVPQPVFGLAVVRFLAGVASAMVLISSSVWLIQAKGFSAGTPLMFAGVGTGIAISAELVFGVSALDFGSLEAWLVVTAAGLLMTAFSWLRMTPPDHAAAGPRPGPAAPGDRLGPVVLIVAYGVAGFGYIITATYLPIIAKGALGGIDPLHLWTAFGLGAVPSCFFWHALHRAWGTRKTLAVNLATQVVGVALPALTRDPLALLASALMVGGSFIGTVTIVMLAARAVAQGVKINMLAAVTASYGVGQIIGPLVAAALFSRTQSFDEPLLAAAAALALGTVLCLVAPRRS
ncbi:YbfB/YjiJ family MFS transporter [Novispirillum sp. DQ9]|uniref:YbfB/YjiJ family MFS transporter n=1 Tax=Novispirillum sp. DQ9 TaxID=3398612 RepID=UPI003C7CD86C